MTRFIALNPIKRLYQLTRSALIITRQDGIAALVHRTIRWLHGERRYHGSNAIYAQLDFPAPDASPTRSQTFDQARADAYIAQLKAAGLLDRAAHGVLGVSIIMPTRDRCALIGHAIESVLAQTYPHWELIIVDDGSQDGTAEHLTNKFTDPRIRILSVDGMGVSAARNIGLHAAKHPIIAYLDSDNRWLPDYLAVMLASFLYYGTETLYAAIHAHINADESFYRGRAFNFDHLRTANYIDINAFMHTTAPTEQLGGFDESLLRMGDWDLILRYTGHFPPRYVPVIGVHYDASERPDRITNHVSDHYREIVRARHQHAIKSEGDGQTLHFALKIACPHAAIKEAWGDYHFARALQRSLIRLGHTARIDFMNSWYSAAKPDDINLVLRGRSHFVPPANAINLLWLISHPTTLLDQEPMQYDHVFVASIPYTQSLQHQHPTAAITALLQCTDPIRFRPDGDHVKLPAPVLFVGNRRGADRPAVRCAAQGGIDMIVYGAGWQGHILDDQIGGEYIPNDQLASYYRSAAVVLADHWSDMREHGFIANRVFDVLACGTRLITDAINGLPPDLADHILTFHDLDSLDAALRTSRQASDPLRWAELAHYIRTIHTFDDRAAVIAACALKLRYAKQRSRNAANADANATATGY